MNTWLLFTLLAPLLWGTAMVFDGATRRNLVKDDQTLTWVFSTLRLPFAIILLVLGNFGGINIYSLLLMLISGFLWTWPIQFYTKALENEDTSNISIFMQTIPIFTLAIAFFMIGEKLHSNQFIAFIFLITAGILASLKREGIKWKFGKGILLITTAGVLWALSDVMFKKFETDFNDYWSAFAIYFLGSFLVSVLLLGDKKSRRKILQNIKKLKFRAWFLSSLSTIFGIGGTLSFTYALTLGKASLTSVFIGFEPLMIIGIGYLLSPFVREVKKEKLDKKNILIKGGAIILIFAGLVFLNLQIS